MKEYMEEFEVSYYSTNNKLQLTQNNLLEFLQDIAIRHSDSLGYTLDVLAEQAKGWVLTNWHITVDSYPTHGDKIRLRLGLLHAAAFKRNEAIWLNKGQTIIKAASRWVFMDFQRRRPTSIPKEMEDKYYSGLEPAIADEKYAMKRTPLGEAELEYSFNVRRSETDTNGHTNNTKYVAWAIDMVNDKIYDEKNNFDISVVYRKECYKNSLVLAKSYSETDDAGITKINTYFYDGNNEDVIFCQVETLWK